MGAQCNLVLVVFGLFDEKGILHIPGGMFGRKVQGSKVVPVIFHFRTIRNIETNILEYANDPETQLFESGLHLVIMATEQANLFKLMFGGYLSLSDCGEELREEMQAAMQSLMKIIAYGQKLNVFSKQDVLQQTLGAMSMVYGLSMMVTSGMLPDMQKSGVHARALVLQVFDVLFFGLKTR